LLYHILEYALRLPSELFAENR
jgi:Xaa-Pro aminopeptidase